MQLQLLPSLVFEWVCEGPSEVPCGCYVMRANIAKVVADLVKLDSLLDSGHSWAFQRSLLAGNAAEACQTCATISIYIYSIQEVFPKGNNIDCHRLRTPWRLTQGVRTGMR